MRVDARRAAAAAVIGIAAGGTAWLILGDGEGAAAMSASAPAAPASGPASRAGAASGADTSEPGASAIAGEAVTAASAPLASASMPASSPGGEAPAAWSLADARVAGDDRAPPVRRAAAEPATPAWQLDDHPAYARREQERHQAVQRAFVAAAEQALPELDQQIERGRAMGLSPEQLAKGEEKRRRIAEMQARMRAALAASGVAPDAGSP